MDLLLISSLFSFTLVVILILVRRNSLWRNERKHIDSLDGKHVVITGGSSGIGFALAKECLSHGASITLIARNPDRLAHAASHLSSFLPPNSASPHERILLKLADVSNASAVAAAITESFAWKPIDILICNAGIAMHGPFDTVKVKDLAAVAQINLLGSVYPVHAAIPLMKTRSKQHPCSIVLMSSLACLSFVCEANVYTPTKYALKGLAEVLRFELMPHNIKVSLACPGFTDTPMLNEDDKDIVRSFTEANKIVFYNKERLESAEEVASKTVEGMKRGDFLITTYLNGVLLRTLGRGMVPAESLSDAVLELLLLVPVRLLSFVWCAYAKRVIRRQYHEENLLCKTVRSDPN